MVYGLTHSLVEENMLHQRAEPAVVAKSSCSPVGSHFQREETKEYVDVISAEAYLLQSTEEEKSEISKSDQILKKASQSKEAQILRLCRDASYAECLEMGQLLRSKPVSSALEWIQRVAELDSANGFFVRPVRTR